MLNQHKSHLVSTYRTAVQHLAEIRQAVSSGKSPAGSQLTPLPEPARSNFLAGLNRVAAQLEDLLDSSVTDWRKTTGAAGLAATRMWANLLLRTVEELIRDLLPSRMSRRYGALKPAECEQLQREVESVLASLSEATFILEQAENSRGQL
jgi:hypothetical protein